MPILWLVNSYLNPIPLIKYNKAISSDCNKFNTCQSHFSSLHSADFELLCLSAVGSINPLR